MLRTTILITFGMLIICIFGGCAGDPPQSNDTDSPNPTTSRGTPPRTDDGPPAMILCAVTPAPGGAEIPPNTQFSLIFCQAVVAVTVDGTAATGSGINWTASPMLQEGDGQTLDVRWTNRDGSSGSQAMGPYTVRTPDTTPPRITGGTVTDGAVDVDPAPLNAGGIEFTLDEAVAGTIKLTDEAGVDLNWFGTVAGQTALLTPFPFEGQELVNETTYKIEIDVHDGASNPLQTTITFVTKPK